MLQSILDLCSVEDSSYKDMALVGDQMHFIHSVFTLLSLVCVIAVQNEADLQAAYTSAIMAAEDTPMIESGGPIDYDFSDGRA